MSTQGAKSTSRPKPLSYMTKLTGACFVYRPDQDNSNAAIKSSSSPNIAPKVIVVAGWIMAKPANLAKYIDQYRAIYPTSTIILLTCEIKATLQDEYAKEQLRPAISVMREVLDLNSSQPELLVHLFSNGGSCILYYLYKLWSEATPTDINTKTQQLPAHITIYDSAPSQRYQLSIILNSVRLGVPRSPIWTYYFIYLVSSIVGLWWSFQIYVLGFDDKHITWQNTHNDPSQITETRRTYIYGDKDQIIPAREILEHAEQAQKKGFIVRKELFKGGQHCRHVVVDSDRYWRIIRESWEG